LPIKTPFKNSKSFLSSIENLYRMDRGDRVYVKRQFQRWLQTAELLAKIDQQKPLTNVLDVGCGSGFFMLMLGGNVVGIDNAENVEVCRKRGLTAYAADLENDRFPLENETFDAAVCLEVMEHLRNPNNCLNEVSRLLKPGGHLLISTPNSQMPSWRIRDFLFSFSFISRAYINRTLGKDEVRYSKEELAQLLKKHGFEVQGVYYPQILLPKDDLLFVAAKRPLLH
jgi:2-polyprenyl-3-methyl-5-hydroxy-6-metoxy-1,4-benzoquinol methylase